MVVGSRTKEALRFLEIPRDSESMRRPFPSGPMLAFAATLLLVGCGADGGEERTRRTGPGAELMAQQAPPAVSRPSVGAVRGPQLRDPAATAGRFPFYWTRAVYSGYSRGYYGRGASWATDFPKGDRQFLVVLKRLVRLNAYDWENPVLLSDPNLRKFPVLYMVEVGYMEMTPAEVEGLRGYLDSGGFLIVDDFWGQRQWDQFERNIRRVYPDRPIVDIDLDHDIYHVYYDIEEVVQVPAIGRTYNPAECWGCYPQVKGMYDDEGRLSVIINFNTDLGDAWEWAESPAYPLYFSTYAYEMGVNMIIYAMTH